jgi:outer membrane protein assembly factor BamB
MLSFRRTVIALLMAFVGFGVSTLFRSDGLWGNFALGLHFRWTPTSEDTLVRRESSRQAADVSTDKFSEALAHPEWPDFRGPNRDGQQHGPILSTDWNANPPKQVWKVPVGPGWSSFAVAGPMLFTQEQRGQFETVVCYASESGLEIWTKQVESRFDDPLGGPGPRATPTIADSALYVMGARGNLLKLDPKTGNELWQQEVRKVADREPPMWGFSSSPLVVDSLVIVHAGGKGEKGILAFNTDDGKPQWSAASGDHSYSSPQLSTIDNERVILMLTNAGLNILDPATGAIRLDYKWPFNPYRALQPQVLDGDSVLLPSPMGAGTRRIRVTKTESQMTADEVWTTRDFKPEFNDLVVYKGYAYGFDAAIFTCIDLQTGKRKWKGGRYGKGQVLLQEDSGLLIVMGEQGEVVLLKADPKEPTELGRFQAITGKTWNHPVLIGDRLYVRNAEEAACYRVPLAAH